MKIWEIGIREHDLKNINKKNKKKLWYIRQCIFLSKSHILNRQAQKTITNTCIHIVILRNC